MDLFVKQRSKDETLEVIDAQRGGPPRPADKDVPRVRATLHMAQEVGARLGQARLLLGSMSVARPPAVSMKVVEIRRRR